MLKSAPRIMAIVLLVAIAVLMVIAGGSSFTKLFNKVEANTDKGGNTNIVTPPGDIEAPPVTPINSSKFPKKPTQSDMFLYTQTVDSDSALKLEAVHQTAQGILIVVSGAPASGDFTVARQSITIINMSIDGTLNKCLTLPAATPTYFICSQLTVEGLVVAVKDENKCFIYTVDYELKGSSKVELESVNMARIFPLSEGFMFLAERAQNTVYLINKGNVVKSAAIQSGSVLEIIEMRSTFNIFINGINGYSVITLNKDLIGFSQISVPFKKALKVMPVAQNNIQKFLVVEQWDNDVYVSRHSAAFRESECDRVGVGKAEGADIYQNGDSIFLLMKGSNPRVYLMDMKLNFTLSTSALYNDIKDIYSCEGYNGGYLMLTKGGTDNIKLTDIRNDGTISTRTIGIAADYAHFVINLNRTISIIYTSTAIQNKVNIVGMDL